LVFQVDYGDHDHVFTEIQNWYRKKVDAILIGDIGQQQQQQQQKTITHAGDANSNVKNTPPRHPNNLIPSSSATNLNNVR